MRLIQVLVFFAFNILISIVLATDYECGIQNVTCTGNDQYRSISGACNNKKHPNWGTIHSLYSRLLPPKYQDGVDSFALAKSGNPLPNARSLTVNIYTDGVADPCEDTTTLSSMMFGQAVAHDLSFTYLTQSIDCCTPTLQNLPNIPKECANIEVSSEDPYYSYINATCLPMERTLTNKDLGCQGSLTYAEKVNDGSSYLDLSIIYGHTEEKLKTLRTYTNGTLLVEVRNNQEWPASAPRTNCPGLYNKENTCYRTGDGRFIQNPQLTLTHILWIRNHNKIARTLLKLNRHWNDEKVFQVARSINIAEWQHITYYDLLPYYAGLDSALLRENKVVFKTLLDYEFINDYDENQSPHIYNEFAHAAFRQFHSLIAGKLGLFSSSGCQYDSLVLRDHVDRPVALEKDGVFDGLLRGSTIQLQMPSDIYYDSDFTREFFLKKMRFGEDIKALDLQRSRDHGVASYNDMRAFCGLPKASNFSQFLDVMTQDKVDMLKKFYEHVDDVDLIVGGGMETNVKKTLTGQTLAGPTFLCIMFHQFRNVRRADRFWYEHESSGFTSSQLREIRKILVSKIFCDNGNNITKMQKFAFHKVELLNPLIPCALIEGPNLNYWKEY